MYYILLILHVCDNLDCEREIIKVQLQHFPIRSVFHKRNHRGDFLLRDFRPRRCRQRKVRPFYPLSLILDYLIQGLAIAQSEPVDCDLVRWFRLQVQRQMNSSSSSSSQYQYRGSFDAAVRILQTEGLHGIYKGYAATLLSYGPFSALYFLLYEEVTSQESRPVMSAALSG